MLQYVHTCSQDNARFGQAMHIMFYLCALENLFARGREIITPLPGARFFYCVFFVIRC